MDYHPLLDLLSILFLSAIVLGFTTPSSTLRLFLLPILGCLSWYCALTCPLYITRSAWASAVGGYTLSLFLHYLDVGVLSQWGFDLQGPSKYLLLQPAASHDILPRQRIPPGDKSPSQRESIIQRLLYGLLVCFSWRFINTPDQAPNIPRLDPRL